MAKKPLRCQRILCRHPSFSSSYNVSTEDQKCEHTLSIGSSSAYDQAVYHDFLYYDRTDFILVKKKHMITLAKTD